MRKLAPLFVLAAWLIPAATAFAGDNGQGLYGETDDKVVTYFCLGVVIFFALFVVLASWLQAVLDRRKEQRKAVELRKRVGW
jgi:Kef-type K+ transport system membrane component KefB